MNPITQPLPNRVVFARQLVSKLERLSADSYWAHQASGVRGSLLRAISEFEAAPHPSTLAGRHLDELIERAYTILVKAAREIS